MKRKRRNLGDTTAGHKTSLKHLYGIAQTTYQEAVHALKANDCLSAYSKAIAMARIHGAASAHGYAIPWRQREGHFQMREIQRMYNDAAGRTMSCLRRG